MLDPQIAQWPDYCCAILRTPRGRLLLEERGPDAANAPGQLTCFGGRREPGEDPDACILRELFEELRWRPPPAEPPALRVRLIVAGRPIAWFYSAIAPDPSSPEGAALQTEPGRALRAVDTERLDPLPISPWHLAALRADAAGVQVVRL